MSRVLGYVVLAGVMLMGATVSAQDAKKLEPVVVTATKTETPAEQLGASVTVVTGEDFRTYHWATVDEALRNVPGLDAVRSGSFGKTTSVKIRGANPNQVQVLIDGARVKSPTLGQAEFADISPDLIERVEIIRGPQSTLYGADAIGGVINIITKKGKGPFSAWAQQEAGSFDTLASRGGFSGSYDIFDYALSLSHFESNGQFQNDGTNQNALNGRVGLTLPGQSSLGFILRYNRTDTDLPIKFFSTPLPIDPIIDTNNSQESETLVTTLTGRTRPLPWWESEVRLSRYENSLGFHDVLDRADTCAFPPCTFPTQTNVLRREAEWINHLHLGTWSTSSVGLEYRHEEGENKLNFAFKARSHTQSVFFQEQLRFFDRLFASGGFRVEDHSVFGTKTTERGSLAFLIREWGMKIRGGAGSGFRAPTFNDLFFPGFSEPSLRPETSFSYDVGVDQKLWENRLRLGLTYFRNEFTNLITFFLIPTPPFSAAANVGKARAAGIEFTGEADLLDNLLASLNYTYTDTEDLTTDRLLPREPRHRWNIGLTWDPIKRLSVFTQVHTRSRQFERTGGLADPKSGIFNRGNTRVDVGSTYRLVDRYGPLRSLELTGRVVNLLNEGYAEARGFPALGINGLVGLRAAF